MAESRRPADTPTRMSAEEIDAFLDGARTLVLTTLRRDGSPVAHPLWFVRAGSDLYVDTRRGSLHHRNLRHDDRVCAVVETGASFLELRGVRIEGRCHLVEDPAEIESVDSAIAAKGARIGSGLEGLPSWFAESRMRRRERGERVVLGITRERIFSWDFSKVREHYRKPGPDGGL